MITVIALHLVALFLKMMGLKAGDYESVARIILEFSQTILVLTFIADPDVLEELLRSQYLQVIGVLE